MIIKERIKRRQQWLIWCQVELDLHLSATKFHSERVEHYEARVKEHKDRIAELRKKENSEI